MTRVLVVDDQRIAREYMEHIVSEAEDYTLSGSLTDADFAVLYCERNPVDLVLMDVCTRGQQDGIEVAAQLKKRRPAIKIIIVTSMAEQSYLKRARTAGADSFWYKDISPEDLLTVMNRTVAGESIYPDQTPLVEFVAGTSSQLSEQQIRVLRLVCDGLEYNEIAERLHCSVHNVKYHVSQILQITGYVNRVQLAVAVTNKRFIIPDIPAEKKTPVVE
ncbi:MAG: response regulator transcription factor [Oscillospiraceae bacterium]|nr:response regulator transcription factor [Oscillospiraceae bacterium]